MRNTVQRTLVLETVKELKCHATAEDVYRSIVRRHPDISRATVYRNLNLLSSLGEIARREVPGSADRYDHRCHDHYHIRCARCDRVFDVDMAFISDLEQRVNDARGFAFTGHDIVFRGICPECGNKKTPES